MVTSFFIMALRQIGLMSNVYQVIIRLPGFCLPSMGKL